MYSQTTKSDTMPNLSYVDFIPHLVTKKSCFSTLSLTSGMPGPSFEGYESLVDRTNVWLQQNPDARVISCESLVVEGVYDIGDDGWTGLDDDTWDERRFPAYITILRIWITSLSRDSRARTSPCQIGYRDILPARLETNPEAIGPKYEPLSNALNNFNQRLANAEEELLGRVVSMETCTCRFTTKNCGLDPDRTFWMTVRKMDVHCYQFFRLFYLQDQHAHTPEIGFTDFTPQYTGNPKKVVKAEHFVHLTRRAEQWFQTTQSQQRRLLNVQTLDHNMFFKCVRDAIGHEKKVLDNPHCVHVYGQSIYHTKVLRLYFTRDARTGDENGEIPSPSPSPTASTTPSIGTHVLHKTFHVAQPVLTSSVRINGEPDALLPNHYMEEVMARVRRWIVMKGVHVTGVETVKLATTHSRDSVTAEDTHFESHGHRASCVIYAIRLYVDDECGALSKKDLNPEPRNVKLSDRSCTLL